MQYISKKHIVVLMGLVVVLGGALLLGERFSRPLGSLQGRDIKKNPVLPPPQSVATEGTFLSEGEGATDLQQFNAPKSSTTSAQSKLSYTQALELYKNNILQFNDLCQIATQDRSFRLGNEVMVDNRSRYPRTISIGSASVVVGPYDYGFIILRERGMSVPVRCEERENVGALFIQ